MYWFGLKSPLTDDYFVYRYNDWDKFVDRIKWWNHKSPLHVRNVLLVPFEANNELIAYLKCKSIFEEQLYKY